VIFCKQDKARSRHNDPQTPQLFTKLISTAKIVSLPAENKHEINRQLFAFIQC